MSGAVVIPKEGWARCVFYAGEVLWVSDEALPSAEDIPSCSCGAKRVFEFQILPQLLNHLKVLLLSCSAKRRAYFNVHIHM